VESPPLRPAAGRPAGQPARPDPEYARRAAPQPLDPYGRSSARNATDEDLLDIPAFLRRAAN
jgi:cell division protein FtsZ